MSQMITQSRLTLGGIDLKTPPLPNPPKRTTSGELPGSIGVTCVWWGDQYPISYVEKLFNMVERNLSVPHVFYCVTPHKKVPDGVTRLDPPRSGKGWWQKVNHFHPGIYAYEERMLALDLDIIIERSLDLLVSMIDSFCMIENYGPNKGHAAHNSSVMLWTPCEETSPIYECFTPEVMNELHGDQCWIWRVMRDKITNFPQNLAVSYKYEKFDKRWRHRDEKTAVTVFHGRPKPHEINDYPKEHWR